MTPSPHLEELGSPALRDALKLARATALASYLASGDHDDAEIVECRRRAEDGLETVVFDIRVERPQELGAPILRSERVAAVFTTEDSVHPVLFAVREDFPYTPHQNAVPPGNMHYPCIDDRPWPEARATWTPLSFVERVRWWFAAAARGALTDDVQAVDPLFVSMGPDISVPRSVLDPDAPTATMVLHAAPSDADQPELYQLQRGRTSDAGAGAGSMRLLVVRLPPRATGAIRLAPRAISRNSPTP